MPSSISTRMRAAFGAILAMSALVPAVVHADTNPWTWYDQSSQLSDRTNRPIWAVANAGANTWYLTDGQDLGNGGHVWFYNGSSLQDDTSIERANGVSRVDDIVSDGQTALFLKNVSGRNNLFEIARAQNRSYTNVTGSLRQVFATDEGISSITGRNGMWYIVTTKARLLRWDSYANSISTVTLPAALQGNVWFSEQFMGYNNAHGSAGVGDSGIALGIVPVGTSSWLLAGRATSGDVRFYTFDGSSFTDVTGSFNTNRELVKLVSNGKTALIAKNTNGSSIPTIYSYDGQTVNTISVNYGTTAPSIYDWSSAITAWNGTSWMVITGNKNVFRIVGNTITTVSPTGDYFDTISGDQNGMFVLGGALSSYGNSQPSYPLTAKFAVATEGYQLNQPVSQYQPYQPYQQYNGNAKGGTFTSANGPTLTTSGNPANFVVGNGNTFVYRANATDPNGVDRIDLYVNGARINTCFASYCEFSSTYFTNGQQTRSVTFAAVTTDKQGYSTDNMNNPDSLLIDQSNNGASQNGQNYYGQNGYQNGYNSPSYTINASQWVDPSVNSIRRDQSVTYNVTGQTYAGVQRIDLYTNGVLRRTCNASYNGVTNMQCAYDIYGGDYSQGSTISLNARVTDVNNNTTWTQNISLLVTAAQNASSNNGNSYVNPPSNNANSPATWIWSIPNESAPVTDYATFHIGAWDSQGLNKIDIWANGSIRRTCTFGNANGNQECSFDVRTTDFASGQEVFVNARAEDSQGNVTWSNAVRYRIGTNAGSNGYTYAPANGQASSWVWLDPNVTTVEPGQTVNVHVGAWDPSGIQRIEISVNGYQWRTCTFNTMNGNQECVASLTGDNSWVGSPAIFTARIVNGNGTITTSNSKQVTFTQAYVPPAPAYQPPVYQPVYMPQPVTIPQPVYVAPVQNQPGSILATINHPFGFKKNDTITVSANGSDANGTDRIELIVNAFRVKTCYNVSFCSWTGGPFPTWSSISYGANLFDTLGTATFSGYKAIKRVN